MNVMHYAIHLFALLAYLLVWLLPCQIQCYKANRWKFYFHLIYAFLQLFQIRICEDPPNANESSTECACKQNKSVSSQSKNSMRLLQNKTLSIYFRVRLISIMKIANETWRKYHLINLLPKFANSNGTIRTRTQAIIHT